MVEHINRVAELDLVLRQLDRIFPEIEEKRLAYSNAESDYIDVQNRYEALVTRRAELTKEINTKENE